MKIFYVIISLLLVVALVLAVGKQEPVKFRNFAEMVTTLRFDVSASMVSIKWAMEIIADIEKDMEIMNTMNGAWDEPDWSQKDILGLLKDAAISIWSMLEMILLSFVFMLNLLLFTVLLGIDGILYLYRAYLLVLMLFGLDPDTVVPEFKLPEINTSSVAPAA